VRHDSAAAAEWATAGAKLGRELLVKHGLDVGPVDIALHVRPCEGLVRQLDGSVEKRFSKKALLYPIQACPCASTLQPLFTPFSLSVKSRMPAREVPL